MKKDYQKMKYQLYSEIKEQYKKRYQENRELRKKIRYQKCQKKKKSRDKFLQQVKQGPYYIRKKYH